MTKTNFTDVNDAAKKGADGVWRQPGGESEIKAVEVDEDYYDAAREDGRGWCPTCEDFTTGDVLANETHVRCSDCADAGVVGAQHALANGFIVVDRAVVS